MAALEDSQNACVYSWPSVSFAPPVRVSVADSRSQYLTSPAAATARLPNSTPATRSLTAVPVCFAASSRNVGFGAVWECAVVASSATDASRSGSCIALPSRDRPRRAHSNNVGFLAAARTCGPVSDTQRLRVCRGKSPKTGQIWSLVWQITSRLFAPSHAGRCELDVPTSGTRNRRLRGCLVSFARCPRVETDLAAAVSLFHFEFRSIDFRAHYRLFYPLWGG